MTTPAVTPLRPFNPPPLDDDWTRWFVGQWQGRGTSPAGEGLGTTTVEPSLNGQFLLCRSDATIARLGEAQAAYLKQELGATDLEIARFQATGYHALEFYTLDPATGDVLAYLFDNLRCVATGRGRRVDGGETVQWAWLSGHRSTRITRRLEADRLSIVEQTPLPDGTVMEERTEMVRVRAEPVLST